MPRPKVRETNSQLWRKRCLVLPGEVVERLFQWNGGQSTMIYRLASSGMRQPVSLSMIDMAIKEGEWAEKSLPRGAKKKDLGRLLDDLQVIRHFWKEHGVQEAAYEYDNADYGLTDKTENKIETGSG